MSDVERLPTLAQVFDARARGYHPTSRDQNELYITGIQTIVRQLWQLRGYVFLNQAYQLLGLPNTRFGQMYGWYLEPLSQTPTFFFDPRNTPEIIVDFNPDGIIWDFIK